MGIGGISIWQLLIVLVIVLLLFGTKRLGSIGSDLGSAIRGFKNSVANDDKTDANQDLAASSAELEMTNQEMPSDHLEKQL